MIFSAYEAGFTSVIGDSDRQQADGTSMTSIPSLNLTPAMTFGN